MMFLFVFPLKQSEDLEVIFQVLQWATRCDVGDVGDIYFYFSQVNQGNRPRVSQLRH